MSARRVDRVGGQSVSDSQTYPFHGAHPVMTPQSTKSISSCLKLSVLLVGNSDPTWSEERLAAAVAPFNDAYKAAASLAASNKVERQAAEKACKDREDRHAFLLSLFETGCASRPVS